MDIPVYLIAGFLDGGKTTFINGILEDGFAQEDRTLLLRCEDGEVAYAPAALHNVTVLSVERLEALTPTFLKSCEKKHRPKQVIIEYNGMWQLETLYEKVLPANWILYQIMALVDAHSFEGYAKNMGQLMMEKITNADMIIFNRCTQTLRENLRKRNLRMVNRRADIFLENEDGTSEPYLTGEECPFDLTQAIIDIPDDDFGVWYVDVMDQPQRYADKCVHFKAVMCHSKTYPDVACPGRFAMVCCEDDITFLGIVCKGASLADFKNRDWVEVTARIQPEHHDAYQGIGPILYVNSICATAKPTVEVVTF